MRLAVDIRSAGYPVVVVMLLVAIYCLLVGSDRVAGALALAGIVLLAVLSRVGGVPDRRAAG
jgi:hypothetical protein